MDLGRVTRIELMRICFVGDSFVNGTGDPDCLGWVGRIVAAARGAGVDITAYDLGIRGDTSTNIAARWRREIPLRLPEGMDGRVVFSFGVNDCCPDEDTGARRVPPDLSRGHAEKILSGASAKWPVLMIGPTPIADPDVNARTADLNTALKAASNEVGVPYCDVFGRLAASKAWMREVAAVDGAHPRAMGYRILADLVGAWDGWRRWVGDDPQTRN